MNCSNEDKWMGDVGAAETKVDLKIGSENIPINVTKAVVHFIQSIKISNGTFPFHVYWSWEV
jgi:hypothetical protein